MADPEMPCHSHVLGVLILLVIVPLCGLIGFVPRGGRWGLQFQTQLFVFTVYFGET